VAIPEEAPVVMVAVAVDAIVVRHPTNAAVLQVAAPGAPGAPATPAGGFPQCTPPDDSSFIGVLAMMEVLNGGA
jgi:hypothetical protein